MSKQVHSHCRGCVSSCGLVFEVEDNRIVSHRANRQSLVSAGFKCIKGDMSVEFLNGGEPRYTQSQQRNVSGELESIGTEALMDELAVKVRDSIERHGPRSVALYFGTAGYRKAFNLSMMRQFMAGIGSPLVFSTMTIDQSAHWVVDGRMGIFATGRPFFEDVDVICVTGTNPVISRSSPYQAVPLVNQTAKLRGFAARGGKLIVIDPRKTETARQAHLHLQPIPGTDAEIFAGLIRVVLENGWQDKAFCERYVQHVQELREAVAPFTLDLVSALSGLPANALHEAARLISHAKKPSVGFGTGTSMSPNANTAAHMIEALNAICGGYTRAGDVVRNPGVFMKRPSVEMVVPPTRSWEAEPKLRSGHGTLYGEFPSSRLADEILTAGKDQIRILFVLGANPAMAFGEPERFCAALRQLDCLIVIEPRPTETTALANYIVAPPLQYEVADFNLTSSLINPEAPVVQYTDAVVQPPPGTITEWKFFHGLANRLGFTLDLAPAGFGSANAKGSLRLDPGVDWSTEQLIEQAFQDAGLSLDEVKRHPNGMLVQGQPVIVTAPETDDGARLDVCPDDVAQELRNIFERPSSPSSRRFRLVVRRINELMNSEFRGSRAVRERFSGGAPLYVHPDDIAAEGLSVGEIVGVEGAHGTIQGRVTADLSMRVGVVSMSHCWDGEGLGTPRSGHTSCLVSMKPEHVQKFDAMPQQSSLAVNLVKLVGAR